MLRLLVTGSRTWDHPGYIRDVLDGLLAEHDRMVLYLGMCRDGADAIAHAWYVDRQHAGAAVALAPFPVDRALDGPGRAAPQRRNVRMVREFADAVDRAGRLDVAEVHGFLRDDSDGTTGCLKAARRAGFQPTVHRYEEVVSGG